MRVAAAAPTVAADGSPIPALLPAWAGTDPWAKLLAWAAVVIELLGGAFILLGLCTRFWALLQVVCHAWDGLGPSGLGGCPSGPTGTAG